MNQSTDIDKNLKDVILLNGTKINVNTEKQEEKMVTGQSILTTGDTTYYRKDVSNESISTDGDEQGGFTVAGIYTKTIGTTENEEGEENSENELKSQLVIFKKETPS